MCNYLICKLNQRHFWTPFTITNWKTNFGNSFDVDMCCTFSSSNESLPVQEKYLLPVIKSTVSRRNKLLEFQKTYLESLAWQLPSPEDFSDEVSGEVLMSVLLTRQRNISISGCTISQQTSISKWSMVSKCRIKDTFKVQNRQWICVREYYAKLTEMVSDSTLQLCIQKQPQVEFWVIAKKTIYTWKDFKCFSFPNHGCKRPDFLLYT